MDHSSIVKFLEEDEDESTHSKDQLDAFLETLNQEIEGKLGENPSHDPDASTLQPRNDPIRPQPQHMELHKTSSQRPRGPEQPVDPVSRGPKGVQICGLIRTLMPLVDEDRKVQLRDLYYQVKKKETTKEGLFRRLKDVVGDQMTKLALSKFSNLQQRNVGIKVPGRPNQQREPSTSAETSAKESDPRGVRVNQLPSTSSATLSSPAKLHDLQKSHMERNQRVGSNGVAGAANSALNTTTVPNYVRPTSVSGPSMVQGGPISHFQNNSSLPLHTAPREGSVTNDQTVGPSSFVVHMKQKSVNQSSELAQKPCSLVQQGLPNIPMKQNNGNLGSSNDYLEKQSSKMVSSTSTTHPSLVSPSVTTQLDSSIMVNSPAMSGTILAGANIKMTPKMPYVGQKKSLEALGSSPSPSSKKQKLRETSLDQSIKQLNDVTALSGIDLREEERKSLCSVVKENSQVSKASRRFVHEEEGRMILQKVPLQKKLAEIISKGGLKHKSDDVERCLSLCVEERMRGLLSTIIRTSKQRSESERCRDRTCITSDIRKQINEMNQKAKEEWEKKHGGEETHKNEENNTAKEMNPSEQVKENKKEDRAEAANFAVRVAVGGNDAFLKWKLMAEARQQPSSGPGRYSKKPSAGGRRFGKKQSSPKVSRSISVKDVIAVMEKESRMSRSSLLYRLHNRVCSDVRTQEKSTEVHRK